MEKTNNPVHEKFCSDISSVAEIILTEKETMFDRKFQNYNTKEKQLNFIQSQIKETTEKINDGIEKGLPPKISVENNLEKSLTIAFKRFSRQLIKKTNKIEYNSKLDNDKVVFAPHNTLTISPNFRFHNLEEYHKLINHVAEVWFLQELEDLENDISIDKKYPTGFDCKLHPETVEEIFKIMTDKPQPQISGKLKDFKAIFSQTPQPVKEPVKWLIKHGKTANNTAYHAFLRLMLDCRNKDLTRATLTKANKLFTYNNQPIYPNNKIKYPSSKVKDRWMKSSIAKHFSKISHLIEKQDQK